MKKTNYLLLFADLPPACISVSLDLAEYIEWAPGLEMPFIDISLAIELYDSMQ